MKTFTATFRVRVIAQREDGGKLLFDQKFDNYGEAKECYDECIKGFDSHNAWMRNLGATCKIDLAIVNVDTMNFLYIESKEV